MKPSFWSILFVALVQSFGANAQLVQGSSASDCSKTRGQLPKSFEGQAYAVSGDTLAAVGLKPHIGLWGVKAPDMDGGVPGMRARAALEDMLVAGEHKVACRFIGWDRMCRALAQCTITAAWPAGSAPQPHDLAVRLAEDGMAYGFDLNTAPDWDKDAGNKIAHFESLARQARKGLWPEWLGEQAK